VVRVSGPRGVLTRNFKHLNVDMFLTGPKTNKTLKVDLWLGKKADRASIRTVISHIRNMITGVTKVEGCRHSSRVLCQSLIQFF
jgi:large subunit ribosomal protein L9e